MNSDEDSKNTLKVGDVGYKKVSFQQILCVLRYQNYLGTLIQILENKQNIRGQVHSEYINIL